MKEENSAKKTEIDCSFCSDDYKLSTFEFIEENKEIITMSSKKNEKNEIILQKENEKIQNNLNKERKDNNKIFIGQKNLDFVNESSRGEIEEIKMQLIKEKDKNKKLEDKIKILERDLADEKNKNKKSDIIIVNLRKELENEKKNIMI
jgi:BMFP domain-containing protein YqiC